MTRIRSTTTLAICLGAACMVAGCGHSGRVGLAGRVTQHGEPLADGTILFVPAEATPGPSAGGVVKNGSYSIPAAKGPGLGSYHVTITPGGPVPKRPPLTKAAQHVTHKNLSFQFTRKITETTMQLDFDLPSQ